MNLHTKSISACLLAFVVSISGCAGDSTGGGAFSSNSDADSGDGSTTSAVPNEFQQYNLTLINNYRAARGIAPLTLNSQITAFASAGSTELSQDHSSHAHFNTAGSNGTIWSDGFSTSGAAENQSGPDGQPQASSDPTTNEMTQIQQVLEAMYSEGPGGGHYDNMMNPQYTKLGVGLVEVNGVLYLTNDFT